MNSLLEQENASSRVAHTAQRNSRVLLLSVVPPNVHYTGALMLHSLCDALNPETLSCFSIISPQLNSEIHDQWKNIKYKFLHKPREAKTRLLPGKLGSYECFLKEEYTKKVSIPKIVSAVKQFIAENQPDVIWCTLEGQTMIRVAAHIQRQVAIPMVTQVWDPPTWWLRDNGVDGWSQQKILATFEQVLKGSKTVAAASWAMAEKYRRDYQCNVIPVVPGIPESWALEARQKIADPNKLIIGFAGQIYSQTEWESLLCALEKLDWNLDGRSVELRIFGHACRLNATGPCQISYMGWYSQQQTIKELSACDILYCPYWFAPEFRQEASQSFPSKLTSYLASGVPVLMHSPEYASPASFLQQHDAAFACNHLEIAAICEILKSIVRDENRYRQVALNGSKAFRNYLTIDLMRSHFLKALTGERCTDD